MAACPVMEFAEHVVAQMCNLWINLTSLPPEVIVTIVVVVVVLGFIFWRAGR